MLPRFALLPEERRGTFAVLAVTILLAMLLMTIRASQHVSIFRVDPVVLADPWFQATLADAYFAFLLFYMWVIFREQRLSARLLWLVLILTTGSMAMAAYVLWSIWRSPPVSPPALGR